MLMAAGGTRTGQANLAPGSLKLRARAGAAVYRYIALVLLLPDM